MVFDVCSRLFGFGLLQRCAVLDVLLSVSDLTQIKFLWTVIQPALHRDFMYSAKKDFPKQRFIPISTFAGRKMKVSLCNSKSVNSPSIWTIRICMIMVCVCVWGGGGKWVCGTDNSNGVTNIEKSSGAFSVKVSPGYGLFIILTIIILYNYVSVSVFVSAYVSVRVSVDISVACFVVVQGVSPGCRLFGTTFSIPVYVSIYIFVFMRVYRCVNNYFHSLSSIVSLCLNKYEINDTTFVLSYLSYI